jgi:hypothetical protein
MDNIYSNVLIVNELKDILIKIEAVLLEKNNANRGYDEKLKTLYKEYQHISKKLSL